LESPEEKADRVMEEKSLLQALRDLIAAGKAVLKAEKGARR
jgi:hypothetical protein